ncbi:hypothetical protein BGZ94_000351 [Podila epigama]|nr:hypothetical protein BGZ94_000351 [Podila epigama]
MSNPLFDDFFNLDLLTPSDPTATSDLYSFFLDDTDTNGTQGQVETTTPIAATANTTQPLDLNALLAAHKQQQQEQEQLSAAKESKDNFKPADNALALSSSLTLPGGLTDFSTLAIASSATAIPISSISTATVSTQIAALIDTSMSSSKRPSPEPAESPRKHAKTSASASSTSTTTSSKSSESLSKDDSLVNTTLSAATLQFMLQKQAEAPLIPQLFTRELSREEVEETLTKLLDSTKHLLESPTSSERSLDGDEGNSSEGEPEAGNDEGEKATTHGGLKTQPGIKTDDIPSSTDLKKMTSKERRQLRNKISARNFRVRRKEYISALEGQVLQHRTEAAHLREAVTVVHDENKRIKEELEEAKRQLAQATMSNNSSNTISQPAQALHTIQPSQTLTKTQTQTQVQSGPVLVPTTSSASSSSSLSKEDQMLLSAILGRSPFNTNAKSSMTLTLPTRPQSPIVTFNSQKDMPNSSAIAKSTSWKDTNPTFVHSAWVPEVYFGQEFDFSGKPKNPFEGKGDHLWGMPWLKDIDTCSSDKRSVESPFTVQSVVVELMQTVVFAAAMGLLTPSEMENVSSSTTSSSSSSVIAGKTHAWSTDDTAQVQDYEADKRMAEATAWELQQTLWEVVAMKEKNQALKVGSGRHDDENDDFSLELSQEDPCMLEWLYESMMARLVALDEMPTPTAIEFRHRLSKTYVPTTKQKFAHVAGQEMVPSQQLLLRAGMMRQSSSGIYTIMPYGQRVLDKIENIIDEELELIGCQKLSMPNLLASDNWKRTGRWETTGPEMFKVKDRKGADFLLAPTHEEEVTALIAKDVQSYRQLPVRVYQVGRKYRDELRARSGLLRGKEFLMKDLYTFDVSSEEALKTYDEVVVAYKRILNRIGVPFAVAEADTGNIGGTHSHEFHILSKVGEDSLLSCKSCGYTSNEERAVGIIPTTPTKASTKFRNAALVPKWIESLDLVPRSGVRLNPKIKFGLLKSLATTGHTPSETCTMVAVATAGDRDVNEIKLTKDVGSALHLVDSVEEIKSILSEQQGMVDDFFLCVDQSLYPGQESPFVGQGKTVQLQDPLPADLDSILRTPTPSLKVRYGDYHNCQPGDGCPHCHKRKDSLQGSQAFEPMETTRAIEIGHTFLLGTKYSGSLEATFVPANGGEPEPFHMGCYGLGITRLLASIVEASHDHKGIVWPEAVAPFRVVIVTSEDEGCATAAEKAYDIVQSALGTRKAEVMLDDRTDMTLGFKMKDAELIGYPWMMIVGKGFLRTGKVEIQKRQTGEKWVLDWPEVDEFFRSKRIL